MSMPKTRAFCFFGVPSIDLLSDSNMMFALDRSELTGPSSSPTVLPVRSHLFLVTFRLR